MKKFIFIFFSLVFFSIFNFYVYADENFSNLVYDDLKNYEYICSKSDSYIFKSYTYDSNSDYKSVYSTENGKSVKYDCFRKGFFLKNFNISLFSTDKKNLYFVLDKSSYMFDGIYSQYTSGNLFLDGHYPTFDILYSNGRPGYLDFNSLSFVSNYPVIESLPIIQLANLGYNTYRYVLTDSLSDLSSSVSKITAQHYSFNLKDSSGNIVHNKDMVFDTLSNSVIDISDLDFNVVLDSFSDKLSPYDLNYNSFNSHVIFRDYSLNDKSLGYYYVLFYNDYHDFTFADVPEKNDGKAHSFGSYNFYVNNKSDSSKVCYAKFNTLSDWSSVYCDSLTSILSNGSFFQPLWSDQELPLLYQNASRKWVDLSYYNLISNHVSDSYLTSVIKPGLSVFLKPLLSSSFDSTIYYDNVFNAGWVSFDNNKYNLLNSTCFYVKSFINIKDFNNYFLNFNLSVKSSYISNKYLFVINNRNSDQDLKIMYDSSKFELLTSSDDSFTYNDFTYSNPNSFLNSQFISMYGLFSDDDYKSMSKYEYDNSGSKPSGIISDSSSSTSNSYSNFFSLSNLSSSFSDFLGVFNLIGNLIGSFMATMPPYFVSGLQSIFTLGILVLLIKLFL